MLPLLRLTAMSQQQLCRAIVSLDSFRFRNFPSIFLRRFRNFPSIFLRRRFLPLQCTMQRKFRWNNFKDFGWPSRRKNSRRKNQFLLQFSFPRTSVTSMQIATFCIVDQQVLHPQLSKLSEINYFVSETDRNCTLKFSGSRSFVYQSFWDFRWLFSISKKRAVDTAFISRAPSFKFFWYPTT